jgi:lysyl-tRNA synthetase class II
LGLTLSCKRICDYRLFQEILADFDKYDGKEVILAGRLMGKRIMGKASFAGIERR